jgi:hypothetical protein
MSKHAVTDLRIVTRSRADGGISAFGLLLYTPESFDINLFLTIMLAKTRPQCHTLQTEKAEMPTPPERSLLDRELSKSTASEFLAIANPMLTELVNYGTNLMGLCGLTSVSEQGALVLIYSHIIEMTDGTQVLVSECCPVAAVPLLRSSFEALLALDYVLEENSTRRALAWWVGMIHEQIGYLENQDPETPKGKELQRALAKEKYLSFFTLPLGGPDKLKSIKERLAYWQTVLESGDAQAIETEYKRVARERRHSPKWYELYDGPQSLRQLARRLNCEASYELLYGTWSGIVHPQHLVHSLGQVADGLTEFGPLRQPVSLRHVTVYTSLFFLHASRLMAHHFKPPCEPIEAWYEREIKESFTYLTSATP